MYRIFAFDGVELPEYVRDNDAHNIGTGQALTSFQQISNGFFDNYGANKSPQGIRPVTLSGAFIGSSASNLILQVDTLRAKIGVRGKLSAYFDDGSLRWQWARLQSINTPRQPEHRNWLSFDMTFITAAQVWYKVIVSPEEWTWGDGTWTFGDGTAEIGESGTLATLTATGGGSQTFTVTHGGNIDATNVAVTITGGSSGITAWRYINSTRNEQMGGGQTIALGEELTINGGDRSVWHKGVTVPVTYYINTTGITTAISCTSAHGLTTGDDVYISGTGLFDGIVRNVTVSSSTIFTFPSKKYTYITLPSSATVRKLTSYYSNWRSSFASVWPVLSPGDNTITMIIAGNAAQDATIAWEFYEHYA